MLLSRFRCASSVPMLTNLRVPDVTSRYKGKGKVKVHSNSCRCILGSHTFRWRMLAPLPPTFSWTEPDYTASWNQSLARGLRFLIELALDTSAEWGFGSYLMRNRELNKIWVLLARWAWEDIDLYLNILLNSSQSTVHSMDLLSKRMDRELCQIMCLVKIL